MTTLVVCTTCGYRSDQSESQRPGARLADLLESQLPRASHPGDAGATTVQRTQCLMVCERACGVALHHPGKYSYVFGDLTPDVESVDSLLNYVRHYRESVSGVVAYSAWPEGIKGHFVARIPPVDVAE